MTLPLTAPDASRRPFVGSALVPPHTAASPAAASLGARASVGAAAPRLSDEALLALVARAARPTPQRMRLEAHLASARLPLRAGDRDVAVPIHFQLNGGQQRAALERLRGAVGPERWPSVAQAAALVLVGKGSVEQVRAVTQALLDSPAGRAALATAPDAVSGIRRLAWAYDLGMDCSGYCHHALRAAHEVPDGRGRVRRLPLGDAVDGLDRLGAPGFRSVSPREAEAGDLMILAPLPPERWGHKVVVAGAVPVEPTALEALGAGATASGAEFLADVDGRPPRIRALEVHSSWGSVGADDPRGGVGARVFLLNEDTGDWATVAGGELLCWGPDGPLAKRVARVLRPAS